MALTILLEDEFGGAIKTLSQELEWGDVGFQERRKFRLLKYIDSCGDTTFNTLQLADLLQDFEQLKPLLISQAGVIEQIIRLIKESQNDVHTYIKFYGD